MCFLKLKLSKVCCLFFANISDNNEDPDFFKIKNEPMVSMEMLINEISTKDPIKTDTSNKITLKTPLILKPVDINSDGTIKSQSHIKIGNNIFTIVQKSKPSVSMSVVTKPQSCESTAVKPEASSLKICQPGLKNKPSFSSLDHDYIEDDYNENETTGVSKVSSFIYLTFFYLKYVEFIGF